MILIVVYEAAAVAHTGKPLICQKCGRGRLGSIPGHSKAAVSRRGRPPPGDTADSVNIKCPVCGKHWAMTIE